MKKTLLTVLLTILTITGLCLVYDKAHKVQVCKVVQENDSIITVLHPNGEFYDFYTEDADKYQEDTYIRVSFNELKLHKESYEVNAGNPTPTLVPITDRNETLISIKDRY